VASGVESKPGIKNEVKLIAFINRARQAANRASGSTGSSK
jgi:hypothetical protein